MDRSELEEFFNSIEFSAASALDRDKRRKKLKENDLDPKEYERRRKEARIINEDLLESFKIKKVPFIKESSGPVLFRYSCGLGDFNNFRNVNLILSVDALKRMLCFSLELPISNKKNIAVLKLYVNQLNNYLRKNTLLGSFSIEDNKYIYFYPFYYGDWTIYEEKSTLLDQLYDQVTESLKSALEELNFLEGMPIPFDRLYETMQEIQDSLNYYLSQYEN